MAESRKAERERAENKIKGFDDLTIKVYNMKYNIKKPDGNRYTNYEIAIELGYGLDYINKISGKLKNIVI